MSTSCKASCTTWTLIGLAMIGATFSTMSVSESQNQRLTAQLSPELASIYEDIVEERRDLYMQGLLLGILIAITLVKSHAFTNNHTHKLAFFVAVTTIISVVYYMLMPKTHYMLDYLKTPAQTQAWLSMYKTMQRRYFWGFVLGTLSAIPIAYAYC
jgi:hypothetical protein